MPYAQQHYPFENASRFEKDLFPAQFIAEGLDQTRGWFYTLMVLSTALFDKPPFENLICTGLVLAADGKKLSKRLKNYADPTEIVDKYGADALRLYLINSPVVRAEPLKFKEEGVHGVVKDVFLPWYNAYRFMVQNALALQEETGVAFTSTSYLSSSKTDGGGGVAPPTDVLDRWVLSATRSLTRFVRREMDAYRLYTVVPELLKFIDSLTNVYVRFNRKRIKGVNGTDDRQIALSVLFDVLLQACKVMAPLTPFFTETMFRNLRCALPSDHPDAGLESVHYCTSAFVGCDTDDDIAKGTKGEGAGLADATNGTDAKMEESVSRMMRVIELGRTIREKHKRPVRTPLREMTVVHADADFLDAVRGPLESYILQELNVRTIKVCADPLEYCTLRAEPNWQALGRRLGKAMGPVGAAIKGLSTEALQVLQRDGSIEVQGQHVSTDDVKILWDFKLPEGRAEGETDAMGDGDLIVLLDLAEDDSLAEEGLAREFINRVQKLRKKAGLDPSDAIEVFFGLPSMVNAPAAAGTERNGQMTTAADPDASSLASLLSSQTAVRDTLRCTPFALAKKPSHFVTVGDEPECTLSNGWVFRLVITLAGVLPVSDALASLCSASSTGDADAAALSLWLKASCPAKLKIRAESNDGVVESPLLASGAVHRLAMDTHFKLRISSP